MKGVNQGRKSYGIWEREKGESEGTFQDNSCVTNLEKPIHPGAEEASGGTLQGENEADGPSDGSELTERGLRF